MLRLSSTLLQLRYQLVQKDVIGNGARQSLQWHGIVSRAAGFSLARRNFTAGKPTGRVFASYSIYKGKASLSATPISPTFSKLESGDLRVDRHGVILLSFCPAIGDRKYDREKRKFFALSAVEVGSLISLQCKGSCEFFHDPSMQSSSAGQVRKSLSIKPQSDGSGYMISLNVVDNTLKTNDRFVVPVTTGEFAVLRTAFSFALPHIMGWDKCTAHSRNSMPERGSPSPLGPRASPSPLGPRTSDSEWDR